MPSKEVPPIKELRVLENSVTHMSQTIAGSQRQLEETLKTLEDQVQERTKWLQTSMNELNLLHRLLQPLNSQGRDFYLELIEKLRELLGLSALYFSTEAPTQENVQSIPVKLYDETYGFVCWAGGQENQSASHGAVHRLAASLAIVLSNQHFLRRLTSQNSNIRTICDNVSTGLLLLDAQNRVIYANEPAFELLRVEHLQGRFIEPIVQQILESDQPEFTLRASLKKAVQYKICTTNANKKTIYSFRLLPVKQEDREAAASVFLCQDITEQAHTKALKEMLIGSVAHELKTPITSMGLQLDSICRHVQKYPGETAKTMLEELNEVIQDLRRVKKLVLSWLDISRIEGGALTLMLTLVQSSALVKSALSEADPNGMIDLTLQVQEQAECFMGDRERLVQVFVQLFSNSLRYSRQLPTKVDVKFWREEDGIHITVKDEGVGIHQDNLGKLFSRFYQVDMSTHRRPGGTGLGLPIVKGIIEAHQGKISVSSELGAWTCFHIEIPG